jgi:hypothetical protein
MYARVKKTEGREYLQIVESRRVGDRVTQRLVASLGRVEELRKGGQIDAILASLAKYSEKMAVLGAHERGEIPPAKTTKIGPPLLFGRVWDRLGIQRVLDSLLRDRRYEFPVERAVFMTVVHRLMVSGSDRAADKWKESYAFGSEVENLDLHHLYRAMAWLGEPLPDDQQTDATPFAPRCVKDRVEEILFQKNRDLFSEFDLVFFDTTSIYFEGRGGQTIGQHGNSKDHRPDLKQMVVGVVLDSNGTPICCELWPGNTTDVTTLVPVVERLKSRFKIGRVCIVADRGMISKATIEALESAKLDMEYILGARMRKMKEVRDEVLSRGGRYEEVAPARKWKKDPSPLKVKEVWVGEHRYVVCHNDEEERKDKMDRAAIVASLREALKRGDKSLVGNQGYRRYIRTPDKEEGFEIDEEKIEREERYDGKWVLRTNTKLPTAEVALKYKQLWMVEQVFRTLKSILDNRPVFHKWDETIRGHVFCSFLALVLMKHVQDVMDENAINAEWDDLKRDLDSLEEIELQASGKRFVLRSEAKGAIGKLFQAARVALPQNIRQIEE